MGFGSVKLVKKAVNFAELHELEPNNIKSGGLEKYIPEE